MARFVRNAGKLNLYFYGCFIISCLFLLPYCNCTTDEKSSKHDSKADNIKLKALHSSKDHLSRHVAGKLKNIKAASSFFGKAKTRKNAPRKTFVDKNGEKRDNFVTIPEPFPVNRFEEQPYLDRHTNYVPQPYPVEHVQYVAKPIAVPVEVPNQLRVQHFHIHKDLHRNPCLNGGIYAVVHHDYICICPKEFRGKNCQDRNYCSSGPCKNNGACEEMVNGYKCLCARGFMGNHCEEKNPCQPNPCKSGGSCTISDEDEGFQCICSSGNKGKRCELVDKCKPSPCKNGGTCEEREGKSICLCTHEYKGPTCQEERQCFQQPCLNGATCLEHDEGFNCTCPAGFTGEFCGEHVCHPSPCMHEGRCSVESGHFKCVCPPLFKGDVCEIPHPCHIRPCLNGALCVDSFSGYNGYPSKWNHGSLHYLCICRPGYTGLNCEVDVCKNCDPYAKCINNTCICNPGYKGDGFHCQREARLCHPNPCKNGATCKENPQGGYDCLCIGGYSGSKCEEKNPCIPSPCRHKGQCVALQNADYRCVCHSSRYSGKDCEKITDSCLPNPCLNDGECINEDGKPACKCKGSFSGQFCETCKCPKSLAPNTADLICDAVGECVCPGGFTRDSKGQCLAARAYSPCLNKPCKNGGTCRRISGSQYECICASPWIGNSCETNGCSPNPCLNSGTCYVEDKLRKCHCKLPYTGPRCEEDPTNVGKSPKREVCHPNPCENGGLCQVVVGGYDCNCPVQFTGAHCEVDKCSKCDAEALCIAGICRCKKGYIGTGFHCVEAGGSSSCKTCPSNAKCFQNVCQCTDGFAFKGDQCVASVKIG
ncbi:fibropellin-1-like [Dendronephthya gigantea]|uniref:fibropellin-1-like n=1 Tax=Dendronephthya gigantea TaxID=151771 RepID=UPI00106D3556|nr:fibropellin-1-like [Dendronephthya gigantea]